MIIDIVSVFPEMFNSYMSASIMARAQKQGALKFCAHDLRNWTHDKHRSTDDEVYGGGQGLLMTCPPIFEAVEDLSSKGAKPEIIFFTPCGNTFNQAEAIELSEYERLLMVCGRYEGIDERAYTLADRCYSIGDYILTGGELAAMAVTDAVVRLLPGVLGDEGSAIEESFSESLLEFPQYTRPAQYRDMSVPDVLLCGNHQQIDKWRREQSLLRTARLRPDLLKNAMLNSDELEALNKITQQNQKNNP